jgi:hypothetical protein
MAADLGTPVRYQPSPLSGTVRIVNHHPNGHIICIVGNHWFPFPFTDVSGA